MRWTLFGILVFAQAPDLSQAPAAIWTSCLVQTGVLGWLLFIHLPANDKQLKEILDGKDKHITDITVKFLLTIEAKDLATKVAAAEYKAAMDSVVRHCRDEIDKIISIGKETTLSKRKQMQIEATMIREQERRHGEEPADE